MSDRDRELAREWVANFYTSDDFKRDKGDVHSLAALLSRVRAEAALEEAKCFQTNWVMCRDRDWDYWMRNRFAALTEATKETSAGA